MLLTEIFLLLLPQVSELFSYISKYRAQIVLLDYRLKPFIPDYIPAVGDIDAFLKVRLATEVTCTK